MNRIAVLVLAVFCLLPMDPAQAFTIVDIFQDAYIDDYDQAGTVDGIPNSITNSQALFIGNGIMSDDTALEARGIMTFDIQSFGSQTLDSAKLIGLGGQNSGQTLNAYIYSGNGLVELSDYNASANLIGTLPLATTNSLVDVQPFEMDITAALQNLLNSNAVYAEFRVSSNAMNPFKDAVILSHEAELPFTIPDGQQGPQLVLSFSDQPTVPEPATMLLLGSGLLGGVFLRRKQS